MKINYTPERRAQKFSDAIRLALIKYQPDYWSALAVLNFWVCDIIKKSNKPITLLEKYVEILYGGLNSAYQEKERNDGEC